MSFSSSSSPSPGPGGEKWTNEIYFDPEADSRYGKDYRITDGNLKVEMNKLIEGYEEIKKINVYEHPLGGLSILRGVIRPIANLSHVFMVLDTDKWWWSIEKNDEGVTIQRSKYIEYVRDKYRRKSRPEPITKVKSDTGRRTMKHLISFLYRKDELHKKYNVLTENCQDFAKRIFDEIAENKYL